MWLENVGGVEPWTLTLIKTSRIVKANFNCLTVDLTEPIKRLANVGQHDATLL